MCSPKWTTYRNSWATVDVDPLGIPPRTSRKAAMSTSFEYDQTFSADPAAVLAMLQDAEYVRKRSDETGSTDTTVEITGTPGGDCVVKTVRVLPAPSAAKAFVGDTITVTETQNWSAPQGDGAVSATTTVDFGGPLSFTGTIAVSGSSSSTSVKTTGEFKASVPFMGSKFEKGGAEQTERYLKAEEKIGADWLNR